MASLSWNYRFTFDGSTDAFTVITSDTPDSNGNYAALGIFGSAGGAAITGLDPTYFSADNLLGFGSSFVDGVDRNGVSFDTPGAFVYNLADIGGAFTVADNRTHAILSPSLTTTPTFSWTYSYTLNGSSDTVTIITGTAANSAGQYAAIGAFGTISGQAITGIDASFSRPDNLLSNGTGLLDGLDYNGVSLDTTGGTVNLFDNGSGMSSISNPGSLAGGSISPTFSDNATTSWNYQFSLGGFSDNLTFVSASDLNGASSPTLVFGTFGGQAVTGLDSSFGRPDNTLSFNSGFLNGVDHSGISFDEANGGQVNLFAGVNSTNDVLTGGSETVVTPTLTTAGVFTWSYSFTLNGFTDSFTIVTGTTASSNGGFVELGISGTFDGQAITGLNTNFSPDNTLGFGQFDVDGVDGAGTDFTIAAGTVVLSASAQVFHVSDPMQSGEPAVTPTFSTDAACFCAGTRIATPSGERAVETLQAGDAVLTAAGVARKVRWMGHRSLRCANHPRPEDVHPVRIRAGAFGPGLPVRDLWLSPDHSVFADGCLIQASLLVNGRTVLRDPVASVQYWHLELDTHDVILAEGLPAETYLDTGNRSQFANAPVAAMQPDFRRVEVEVAASLACAPIVTGGAVLEAVRSWLAERAEMDSERAA